MFLISIIPIFDPQPTKEEELKNIQGEPLVMAI